MIPQYNIPGTINLDTNSCFGLETTYPTFQEDLIKFKSHLKQLVSNKESATFYKFGDGDYRFLKGIEVGSAKPGNRALSKPYNEIDLKAHNKGAQLCD